jgi:hypothetical protein
MDLYNGALSFTFGMMLIIVPFLALDMLLMLRRVCNHSARGPWTLRVQDPGSVYTVVT